MIRNPSSEDARRRRNQEEAAQQAAAFERNGQLRGGFCRQHGLSTGTLDSYRKRHGQSCKAVLAPSRFIPVELAHPGKAPASGLAVAMPTGYRIEVSREFDAHTLRHLVAALETA